MVKLVNRAKMFTATTGTGTITLGAAVTSYQTFASAGVANADVVRYVIEDGAAWEIGNGTYTSTGTTMSRSLIASSTGSLLNLSGTAQVFVTATAEDFAQLEATLPSTITVNSASAALTVTQSGSGNALVVEDATSDTTPFIVTANGDVGIGTSTVSQVTNYRTLKFDATSGGNIEMYVAGTLIGEMYTVSSGDLLIGTTSAGDDLIFRTNSTSRGLIDQDGRLAIGTVIPETSAQLQADSTTRGFLPPRMTTAQRDAIASPATGLEVFNTTLGVPQFYSGTSWLSAPNGLYKGNNGETAGSAGNIFRVNAQTLTVNTTIDADENASATGPLTVNTGVTLTVTSGGTLVIL